MTNSPNRHIPELDGLRGFLAWWVVLNHLLLGCGFITMPRGVRLLLRGDYAVDVFIILSGFVIFKLLHDRHENYAPFIIRRFFRLYPVYLVCLLLALILRSWEFSDIQHVRAMSDSAFSANLLAIWSSETAHFWRHLALHLSLLHGAVSNSVLPGTAFAFLGPAWSISLEWQFYLIAPLLFWFFRKSGAVGWLAFVTVVVGTNAIFYNAMQGRFPIGAFLPQKLILFWVGMLSYQLWRTLPERAEETSEMLLAGVCPLVLIFTLSLPLSIWACVLSSSISSGKYGISRLIPRTLRSPMVQKLGAMSYSTYLVHVPCLWVLEWLIFHMAPDMNRWGLLALSLPFSTMSVYFASIWLHRFVEIPGMRLGRRVATYWAAE